VVKNHSIIFVLLLIICAQPTFAESSGWVMSKERTTSTEGKEAEAEQASGTTGGPSATPLPTPLPTPVPAAESTIGAEAPSSRAFLGAINYSALDTLIPSKIGATVGYLPSSMTSLELDYLTASLSVPFILKDLGEISDSRLSLLHRAFAKKGSFNFFYGVTYFDLKAHAGSKIMQTVAGTPSTDLVSVQSLGFLAGLGNRWTIGNRITLGVDWISWAQPVFTLKRENALSQYLPNQSDKDLLERALSLGSYFPRLSLLKVQVGMVF
jgi:hypothetical protein